MSYLLLERSNELRESTILAHLHKSLDICDEVSKNVESVVIESRVTRSRVSYVMNSSRIVDKEYRLKLCEEELEVIDYFHAFYLDNDWFQCERQLTSPGDDSWWSASFCFSTDLTKALLSIPNPNSKRGLQ
jgi:hypothetical protein